MESLTNYKAIKIRVGEKILRHTAGPSDIKSLTRCERNRTRVGRETMRKPSWIPYRITHILSSQQDHAEKNDHKGHGSYVCMKPLTFYQANMHRVRRQITRAKSAKSASSILTLCQANGTKLVQGESENTQLGPGITHFLLSKQNQSRRHGYKKKDS